MIPKGVPAKLHQRIAAVAPIHGVSFGNSITIQFKTEATVAQRAAAEAILGSFNQASTQAEIEAEKQAEALRQEKLRAFVDEFAQLRAWARTKGYPG